MESAGRTIKAARKDPIYLIAVIIAVGLLIFGIYVIGPWYVGGGATAVGSVFDTEISRFILGLGYITPPVMTFIGAKKRGRWATMGIFGSSAACIFIAVLRIVTIGWIPFVWLFPLVMGLVAGVCYLVVSLGDE